MNGQVRRIPFEVMVRGDKAPVYEETLEDLGRFNDQPALPFNAYGTMALARGEFEANSGSSQVFWLLKARPCSLSIGSTCCLMWETWAAPMTRRRCRSSSYCTDGCAGKLICAGAGWSHHSLSLRANHAMRRRLC